MDEDTDFKFGAQIDHSKCEPNEWQTAPIMSSESEKLGTVKFFQNSVTKVFKFRKIWPTENS